MPDPDPNATKTIAEDMNDALVTVTLAGKKEQVKLSDLTERYQKEHVAEQRFREAHELKSAAESAMTVANDLQQGFAEQDEEKLKRAFRGAGLNEEQIDTVFGGMGNATQGAGAATLTSSETADGDADESQMELIEQVQTLTAQMNAIAERDKKNAEHAKKTAVLTAVDKAVDSDPELATLLSELEPEDQRELRELAYKHVATASKTMPWGPKAIQEGLKSLKARRKAWGSLGTQDAGERTPGSTTMPGFGPAGHSVSHLHPTTETKPVGVYDKDYQANLGQRLKETLAKFARKRK